MSTQELLAGFCYANSRFYGLPGILKRTIKNSVQACWSLPLNLAYRHLWLQSVHPGTKPR